MNVLINWMYVALTNTFIENKSIPTDHECNNATCWLGIDSIITLPCPHKLPEQSTESPLPTLYSSPDLKNGLRKILLTSKICIGFNNVGTIMKNWFTQVLPYFEPSSSNAFWNTPRFMTRNMIKQLFRYRAASLFPTCYGNEPQRCPLGCMKNGNNTLQTGGHILGACGNPYMRACYIRRHDQAV